MNVIIANKYKDELSSLDIDVIKRLDGEFDIETITDTFANFYFNRMILDITALKDSFNIATIQRLSAALDATKIILLLSDDPRFNNAYLSKLISLGIYNFTQDINGVAYLMENPNSYRDVAQYHNLAMNDERNMKSSGNANQPNTAYMGNMGAGFAGSAASNPNAFAPNMQEANNNGMIEPTNPGFRAYMGPSYDTSNDPYQNPNQSVPNQNYGAGTMIGSNTKVIGFKDLTDDAGATTLVYMLKKNLSSRKVLAVEMNKNDFSYFNDSELLSCTGNQIDSVRRRFAQFDIVLIDLNNSNLDKDGTCTDVIYLLEPSTIKLNTLMRRDRQALEKIKDKKIVLNKSLLTMSDLKEFEYEAKVNMFYNIPPLDERKSTQMVLDSFLEKLGIYSNGGSGGGLFGIFKK